MLVALPQISSWVTAQFHIKLDSVVVADQVVSIIEVNFGSDFQHRADLIHRVFLDSPLDFLVVT